MGKIPLTFDFDNFRTPAEPPPRPGDPAADGSEITATVTEPVTSVGCDPRDPIWDTLDIPDFLLRNEDGSWKHPELWPSSGNTTTATPAATAPAADASTGALSGETEPLPPEPSAEEILRTIRKRKDHSRLAKLRATQDQAQAMAEGKVWRNGRFVHHDSLTKAQYARVMRELPTMDMKRLFAHLYSEKVE